MDQPSDMGPEPANLRFLRRLVTVLTAVMIMGVLAIVGLLVTRLMQSPALPLPADLSLPAGVSVTAVTYAPGWILIVTDQDQLWVMDPSTGDVTQRIPLSD